MKARTFFEVRHFRDLPNVGPAIERDLKKLGLKTPADLQKQDAFLLYKKMCKLSGRREDPCVLDTYLSIVDFANGAPARPWWWYTKKRKKLYPNI